MATPNTNHKKTKQTPRLITVKQAQPRLKGKALKDSKDKTVLIEVSFLKIHPIYRKRYFSNRKMLAHTENDVKAGQNVLIQECRPISRRKSWKVIEVKQ